MAEARSMEDILFDNDDDDDSSDESDAESQQRPPPQQQQQQQRRQVTRQPGEMDSRKQKEMFILLTKGLLDNLEKSDKRLLLKVQGIIKDCVLRNKNNERGYESVTASLHKKLKKCVPPAHWKQAEEHRKLSLQAKSPPQQPISHQNSVPVTPDQQHPPPQKAARQTAQVLTDVGNGMAEYPRPNTKLAATQAFQTLQQVKTKTPTLPNKGIPVPDSPQRLSDVKDSCAPCEYKKLPPTVDRAPTPAGSLLGRSKTQTALFKEQKKRSSDSRTVFPKTATNDVEELPVLGWNGRDVVSARVAWARLRGATKTAPQTEWFNEDTAEEEKALAVLSEGAQIYMKSILEKALHSARLRQNFDVTRIWHQQRTEAKPEFSIRLGCDVNRQVALAQANAALTAKRMEEALVRQPGVAATDKDINERTLASATSMSDLAIKPGLEKAVDTLTTTTKRNLEVHGGEDSRESPFGRTPKKPKLEVVDFIAGMKFSQCRGGQRASTLSPFTPFFSY